MEDQTSFQKTPAHVAPPSRIVSQLYCHLKSALRAGGCSWLLALGFILLAAAPTYAGHRKAQAAPPPPPIETPAQAPERSSGEELLWDLAFVLLCGATTIHFLWRAKKKEEALRDEVLAFKEKIRKYEEKADELEEKNIALTKKAASLHDLVTQKLALLATAKRELEAVQSRLTCLLEANPGALERMKAKAKRDAEAQAAREREQEKRAQAKQGGAQVQAILTQMKRGY